MDVTPSLLIEMHFDEFKQSADEIIRKYDKLLSNNPSDARAYATLVELRKINTVIPVVKTNDFGHVHGNSIIPIGVNVSINATEKSIRVSEYLK